MESFVFFWKPEASNGFLGNWYASPFKDELGNLFPTNEHYMMWRKALLMNDNDIAARVLKTPSAKYARQLGRKVSGWDEEKWIQSREQIMIDGLRLKFSQNPQLCEQLLATRDKTLVEASPFDRIWGIGVSASHQNATKPSMWKGLNLLGKALMSVRAELLK